MDQKVKVVLRKSLIGATARQKEAARCLGLRRIASSRILKDSPAMRGQARVIRHLVSVEKAGKGAAL